MSNTSGWEKETSPFHQGEKKLHTLYGNEERLEKIGRMIIRPFMPDQHREFYSQLPFIVVGSIDQQGAPWASFLFGAIGFISSPDDKSLAFSGSTVNGDPLSANLAIGSPVSFLGIEPPTRRRNRLNAIVDKVFESGFSVRVVQSFGNCPQYIQTRNMAFKRDPQANLDTKKTIFTEFNPPLAAFLKKADTLFVASHNPFDDKEDTGGVDINHRGGMPGFIRIEKNSLLIPDYRGNNSFNTLGNFVLNPKAGLLFVDFDTGDVIQMTGKTELLLDLTEDEKQRLSAERAWQFTLEKGHVLKNACPIKWTFGDYSPRNPVVNH